jgi:acylphosphatase
VHGINLEALSPYLLSTPLGRVRTGILIASSPRLQPGSVTSVQRCAAEPATATMANVAERIRRRLVAHGRVQGVFFRDSVRRRAHAAGIAGWVRNRADGAVEAVLEGPADAVALVESFFRRGPRSAEVEFVEVSDEVPVGLGRFEVR